ncbi:MAG: 6-hydroxymethylpterin diphosphokinase MptE-like protein [Anaerolineales bacterium]
MSTLRETLKRLTPSPLLTLARETRDGLQRAGEWPAAAFHPWRRESIQKLAALKDIHRGERCFIIGNGPSLKQTDISKLRNEYTFGMNRIYLAFDDWGFPTHFLVSVNSLVIEQCAEDFLGLDVSMFFSWRSRKHFTQLPNYQLPITNLHFLHTTYTGPKFAQDARGRLWEGATVTYVCLQLAFHLGFETTILIGVDHSFVTKGKPNTTIVSQGDDPNHFAANYFGKGFRWQLPDLGTSEVGYLMARQAYETAGRRVLDATIEGKLDVFEKVKYESLFE